MINNNSTSTTSTTSTTSPNLLVNDTAASSHKNDFLPNPNKPISFNRKATESIESFFAEDVINATSTGDAQIISATMFKSHNAILDGEKHTCTVDLLQYVNDAHPLKALSIAVSKTTYLPVNTVFLMGLAVFSSIACRKYVVNYQYGGDVPIGLYAVAEQPSGTGKSWCLNIFQKPFFKLHHAKIEKYKIELNRLKAIPKEELTDDNKLALKDLAANPIPPLFATNATPEALEQYINNTNGFFSAVSSEQGLFNSLLGLSYGDNKKANNNDLILNGYDGGYMNSMRVGRDGYCGYVVGGVALFAQQGSIEKVLDASGGTGLSERFLMLAEPHNLGKRDRTKNTAIDKTLLDAYGLIAEQLGNSVLNNPNNDLAALNIGDNGHRLIGEYLNIIEPHLVNGGKFSHAFLRGAAGKLNIQIMKVASVLHLLDGGMYEPNIDDKHVRAAIGIVHELFEANIKLSHDKGIMGTKAEFTAILRMFETGNRLTERQIMQSRVTVAPFKTFTGNKSELIRANLAEMVAQGILSKSDDSTGKASYSLAQ